MDLENLATACRPLPSRYKQATAVGLLFWQHVSMMVPLDMVSVVNSQRLASADDCTWHRSLCGSVYGVIYAVAN